jgi:hypothetical protein
VTAPAWIAKDRVLELVSVWNAFITSVYKMVGFAVLSLILMGLASYFAVHMFYMFADSWVAPVILSPHHEEVLQLNRHALQQEHQLRLLEGERLVLMSQMATAERAIELNESFVESFPDVLAEELGSREAFLGQAEGLEREYLESQREMVRTNQEFLTTAEPELEAQYEAGLIDRTTYVQSRRNLASLEEIELSVRQTGLQLSSLVRDSRRAADSMVGTLGANGHVGIAAGSRSYDVLLMEQEFRRATIETAKLRRERDDAARRVGMLDEMIAGYERLRTEIQASPYLRALSQQVHLAFVPYDNLDEVSEGKRLVGCSAGLIWCQEVGQVRQVLDGEVTVRHPLLNELLRGVMIEINLEDARWAEHKALYLGSAPLLL